MWRGASPNRVEVAIAAVAEFLERTGGRVVLSSAGRIPSTAEASP